MSHPARRGRLIPFICIVILIISACSSPGPIPQTTDAGSDPDASTSADARVCECPGSELLSREHFADWWNQVSTGTSEGWTVPCEDESDFFLNGTCSLVNLQSGRLISSGFSESDDNEWVCELAAPYAQLKGSGRCLRDLPRPDEACECPEIETPRDRIFRVAQAGTIPSQDGASVSVQCPIGSTLLGGSCKELDPPATALIAGGVDPDDHQTWRCSWYYPYTAGSRGTQATAMCLRPPGPDALTGEPVPPEEFEYVIEQGTIPPDDGTLIVDATCQPGDVLVAGGCYIPEPDALQNGVVLMRTGRVDPLFNRPDTWQCGWRNGSSVNLTGIAVATCMKQ